MTPGRRADLVVFDDLEAPRPRLVFRGGTVVARDGEMVAPPLGECAAAAAEHDERRVGQSRLQDPGQPGGGPA